MSFRLRATILLLLTALSPARLIYSHSVVVTSARTTPQQSSTADSIPRVRAFASSNGVLVQWVATLEQPTLGFNVFRVSNGQTIQLNPVLIAGSVLIVRDQPQIYSWLDQKGSRSSKYYVESVNLHGNSANSEAAVPLWQSALPEFQPVELLSNLGSQRRTPTTTAIWTNDDHTNSSSEISADSSSPSSLVKQWSIANQPALKIGIRADGWYRIMKSQLTAAGFDASGDARNLRLFVGGNEIAIHVSRDQGPLDSSDYVEFWGQGIDTPTSDTQIYWLVNGSQPGLRMGLMGDVTVDAPPNQTPSPSVTDSDPTRASRFAGFPIIFAEALAPVVQTRQANPPGIKGNQPTVSQAASDFELAARSQYEPVRKNAEVAKKSLPELATPLPPDVKAPVPGVTSAKSATSSLRSITMIATRPRKSRRHRSSRRSTRRRNHIVQPALATPAFTYSVEHAERNIYYPAALNGERENFFGPVIAGDGPVVTLTLHNIDTSSSAPALVQVAIQGVTFETHRINVLVNGSVAGSISFLDETSTNQTLAFPVSWLVDGDNSIKLVPVGSNHDTSVAEYVRLTYPHIFRADSDSVRFNIKSNQSARVDGFSTANIRVLDVTDPAGVAEVRPSVESAGAGFALTIPAFGRGKARRIIALPRDRLSQPAWLTLNQPSTLNSTSNAANLVIISFKDFLPALAPLVAQRKAQGYTVAVVDIEDVFDEFSYGVHTPQAMKDFVALAKASWSQPPGYLLLAGDASYDPRNYMGFGNLDFVPTKQIDTGIAGTDTAIETASDDWLTDLNGDGIGDLSVGRLPVKTVADANLVVSKIINYSPFNTANRALLVADTQGSYYFNFEAADDQLASVLPTTMTVQKIYRRLQPSDADARTNIISSLNAGQAVTVYSGHGNVNIWGGSIFTANDAAALTNGNRLSFVVVMDCLNGYFAHPMVTSLAESALLAPNGGAVASFASSGLTIPDGQHQMGFRMFQLLYSGSPIAIGEASRQAKSATTDIDVRRTWILFGDPTLKIR
jgi:hypothetical protein